MRRSIKISNKHYELATNAYTPIAYKNEFGQDFFKDLLGLLKNKQLVAQLNQLEKGNDLVAESVDLSLLEDFDITFFYSLFWVFAKSGNPKIKPFDDFFMEMEEFPLDEVCPLMMEMLNTVLQTKKKQTHQKQQAKKPSR